MITQVHIVSWPVCLPPIFQPASTAFSSYTTDHTPAQHRKYKHHTLPTALTAAQGNGKKNKGNNTDGRKEKRPPLRAALI
jgi:hypothetical protein